MKTIYAAVLGAAAVASMAGCSSNLLVHTGTVKEAAPRQAASAAAPAAHCPEQAAWNLNATKSVRTLYADSGALAADARAGNLPGVIRAGRKLTTDVTADATLPVPVIAPGTWRALTTAYAAAGTYLAAGNLAAAVPQLETGNSDLTAFETAVSHCTLS